MLRAAESERCAACIETLSEEVASLERARASDALKAASRFDALRQENDLLLAAAGRLRDVGLRDAAELEGLRKEVKLLSRARETQRVEALQVLHAGAELAESRYRAAERRRTVDVQAMVSEMAEGEAREAAMRAAMERSDERRKADAKVAADEIRALEVSREAAVRAAAAEAAAIQQAAAREAGETSRELRILESALQSETARLDGVRDSLAEWDAAMAAERAHTLAATECLDVSAREIESALDEMVDGSQGMVLVPSAFLEAQIMAATPAAQTARPRSPHRGSRGGGSRVWGPVSLEYGSAYIGSPPRLHGSVSGGSVSMGGGSASMGGGSVSGSVGGKRGGDDGRSSPGATPLQYPSGPQPASLHAHHSKRSPASGVSRPPWNLSTSGSAMRPMPEETGFRSSGLRAPHRLGQRGEPPMRLAGSGALVVVAPKGGGGADKGG